MRDCKNCDNIDALCCDNCGEEKAPEISAADKEKAMFLTTLGVVLEKHKMSWQDVNVDWKAGTIDISIDMTDYATMRFLTDLHKTTGGFE